MNSYRTEAYQSTAHYTKSTLVCKQWAPHVLATTMKSTVRMHVLIVCIGVDLTGILGDAWQVPKVGE